MKQKSLTRVINKLVDGAMVEAGRTANGKDVERKIKSRGYENLSDWYKPGRMIMAMKPEDREILKEAKDKDFNHRLFI